MSRLYLFEPTFGDIILQAHEIRKGDIVEIHKSSLAGRPPRKFRYINRISDGVLELCNRDSLLPMVDFVNNIKHQVWLFCSLSQRMEPSTVVSVKADPKNNTIAIKIYMDARMSNGCYLFKNKDEVHLLANAIGTYVNKMTKNFTLTAEYQYVKNQKARRPF